MIRFAHTVFSILVFVSIVQGQPYQVYQTFEKAGFKVKCGCNLYSNATFLQMAEAQGIDNVLAAYVCAENESNPYVGIVVNINVTNLANGYSSIPTAGYAQFERKFVEQYATNLKNEGIRYSKVQFQDVTALEYTFDQMGMPTKAIVFLKNKKSYLMQVGTRKNLNQKYSQLKNSFLLLR